MNGVEGIILRTIDYGENHLIVTVLTATYGKFAMMARGAKKSTSPLRSSTTPLSRVHFQTYGNKMPTIQQGSLINPFRLIKSDLTATSYASYAAELMDRVLAEREAHAGLYTLFLFVLESIEAGGNPELYIRLLEARILDYMGVMPDWLHCSACGQKLEESPFFSFELGGPLHAECAHLDGQKISTKSALFKLIYTLQKLPLERVGKLSISPTGRKQIQFIFQHLLEDYAGIYLKTRKFLDSIQL